MPADHDVDIDVDMALVEATDRVDDDVLCCDCDMLWSSSTILVSLLKTLLNSELMLVFKPSKLIPRLSIYLFIILVYRKR
jgi:hypothetical protein